MPLKITVEDVQLKAKERGLKLIGCSDPINMFSRTNPQKFKFECLICSEEFEVGTRTFYRAEAAVPCPLCRKSNKTTRTSIISAKGLKKTQTSQNEVQTQQQKAGRIGGSTPSLLRDAKYDQNRTQSHSFYCNHGSTWFSVLSKTNISIPPVRNANDMVPFFIEHLKKNKNTILQNGNSDKMNSHLDLLQKALETRQVLNLKRVLSHTPQRKSFLGFQLIQNQNLNKTQ